MTGATLMGASSLKALYTPAGNKIAYFRDTTLALFEANDPKEAGSFHPDEMIKTCALLKFRSLYLFLYCKPQRNPKFHDLTLAKHFAPHGFSRPLDKGKLPLRGFDNKPGTFTLESINKFVAHLTEERAEKPKDIPQPKYGAAKAATIHNAQTVLHDAKSRFLDMVLPVLEPRLNGHGKAYLARLKEIMKW